MSLHLSCFNGRGRSFKEMKIYSKGPFYCCTGVRSRGTLTTDCITQLVSDGISVEDNTGSSLMLGSQIVLRDHSSDIPPLEVHRTVHLITAARHWLLILNEISPAQS